MLKLKTPLQKADTVFVMMLFSLFAFTAFVLIIIGVKQYRYTADSMNQNYQIRTVNSYLREKIRQNDINSNISTFKVNGVDILSLSNEIDGKKYSTIIYCYNGYLREQFISEDAVYSLSTGQEIIELDNFEIEIIFSGYINANVTASNGEVSNLYLSVKSNK